MEEYLPLFFAGYYGFTFQQTEKRLKEVVDVFNQMEVLAAVIVFIFRCRIMMAQNDLVNIFDNCIDIIYLLSTCIEDIAFGTLRQEHRAVHVTQ